MEKYLESPLFARITGEEAKRMLNCAKARYRDYKAGSIIFGEDDNQRTYICCWREKCRGSRICLPAREIFFFR